MQPFDYLRPRSLEQAAAPPTLPIAQAMLPAGAQTAVYKGAGIDLLDLMKEGLLEPSALVDLGAVEGLATMAPSPDGGLRLGAAATLANVAAHPLVAAHYPALASALAGSASPQIRNRATLGGNLLQRPRCWYFRSQAFACTRKGGGHCFAFQGDNRYHAVFGHTGCAMVHPSTAATVLVALDAEVELRGPARAARRLPLQDFLLPTERSLRSENDLRPQEILTAVRLAALDERVGMAYLRQGEKQSFDWPLVDVAVVLRRDGSGRCSRAAVVLGAVAPVPHRARAAEQALQGRIIDAASAAQAGRAALQGAQPLSANAYKLPLVQALVERAVLAAAASGRAAA